MQSIREAFHIFARRFGLLNASCCEKCCGSQVSMVQSHILFEVRRRGNPSMQQVAEELGMDVTTFSRQAKSLESKGLIARQISQDDRRVNLMRVTDEGMWTLEQIDRYMVERLERMFSTMTPFERDIVVSSLRLLNDALAGSGCCTHQHQ